MRKSFRMVLCFLLIVLLLVSASACGGTKEDSKAAESTVQQTDITQKDDSKTTDKTTADTAVYDVKIGLWGTATAGNDVISDFLNKKFNINLSFQDFQWGDYLDKLNVQAASGDLPDMFGHPGYSDVKGMATFTQWIKNGVLRPLPDDVMGKYGNIANILKDYDYFKVDNKRYFIPRVAWQPGNDFLSQALWVRTDWMKNVGITEMPKNLNELYTVLKAFTFNDPDKNSKNDTYGMSRNGQEMWIWDAYGLDYQTWIKEDGQWIPAMLSKRNVEPIKYLKKLYDDKILDPDFFVLKEEQGKDKFLSGKTGVLMWTTEAYQIKAELVDKMMKINPDWGTKVVDIMPPVPGPEGQYICKNAYNFWSGTIFSAKVDDKKMDRLLQFYDYLLSPEGLELNRFGIADVNFKKNGDVYESLLPKDTSTGLPKSLNTEVPTSNIKSLVTWDSDGRWLEPSMPKECVDMEKKACMLLRDKQDKSDPRIYFMSTPAKDTLDIYPEFWNVVTKCVLKSKDVEADFESFRQAALKKGGDQAIKEVNEKAKELGIQ